MILELFLIWLFIFVFLMVVNIVADSTTFGLIAGLWLILIGAMIILDGIQYQTGTTILTDGATQTITAVYSDATLPYSTYSFIWGLSFISLSMYIILANGLKKTK